MVLKKILRAKDVRYRGRELMLVEKHLEEMEDTQVKQYLREKLDL